jgi:hypothetical protein
MNKFRYKFVCMGAMSMYEILTTGCYVVLNMHRDQRKLPSKEEMRRKKEERGVYKLRSMSPIGTYVR